jgi:hypothetical protein
MRISSSARPQRSQTRRRSGPGAEKEYLTQRRRDAEKRALMLISLALRLCARLSCFGRFLHDADFVVGEAVEVVNEASIWRRGRKRVSHAETQRRRDAEKRALMLISLALREVIIFWSLPPRCGFHRSRIALSWHRDKASRRADEGEVTADQWPALSLCRGEKKSSRQGAKTQRNELGGHSPPYPLAMVNLSSLENGLRVASRTSGRFSAPFANEQQRRTHHR